MQRAELLAAVRQVAKAGGTLSVSSVVGARGMGRNTFYEHFATVEEALKITAEEATERLRQHIGQVLEQSGDGTPSDVARMVTVGLLDFVDAGDERWGILVRHADDVLDQVFRELVGHIHQVYVHAGAARAEVTQLMLTAVVGALAELLNTYARAANRPSRGDVIEHVVVVMSRLLR